MTAEPYFGVSAAERRGGDGEHRAEDTLGRSSTTSVKVRSAETRHLYDDVARVSSTGEDRQRSTTALLEAENAVQIAQVPMRINTPGHLRQRAALLRQAEVYQARKAGSRPVIMTSARGGAERRDSPVAGIEASGGRTDRTRETGSGGSGSGGASRGGSRAGEGKSSSRRAGRAGRAESSGGKGGGGRGASAGRGGTAEGRTGQAERRRAAASGRVGSLAAQQSEQKAQEADRLRFEAEQAQQQLRQQLLQQFNLILETRDTARGLIVNMSDVLFDFNKYTLRPAAREKLAKISGIILSHPGLRLEVDGYTDSIGSENYNQKLSENRAGGVRDYLVGQGLASDNVTAKGFGKDDPVASNDTAAGRQKNRRVEMVVSGDIIGTPVGGGAAGISAAAKRIRTVHEVSVALPPGRTGP